jgi:hypothetical protein
MNLKKHFLPSPRPKKLGGRKSAFVRKSKTHQNKITIKKKTALTINI